LTALTGATQEEGVSVVCEGKGWCWAEEQKRGLEGRFLGG